MTMSFLVRVALAQTQIVMNNAIGEGKTPFVLPDTPFFSRGGWVEGEGESDLGFALFGVLPNLG